MRTMVRRLRDVVGTFLMDAGAFVRGYEIVSFERVVGKGAIDEECTTSPAKVHLGEEDVPPITMDSPVSLSEKGREMVAGAQPREIGMSPEQEIKPKYKKGSLQSRLNGGG